MRFRNATIPGLLLLLVTAAPSIAQDDFKVHFQAGSDAITAGDYDKAIAEYTEVIRIEPNIPGAYVNRAVAYGRLKKNDEALADYTRAIEKSGTDERFKDVKSNALTNRGNIYWHQDKLDLALADAEAAVAVDGTYPYAFVLRACVRYDMGDYDKAVVDYGRAKQLKADIRPLTFTREEASRNAMQHSSDPQVLLTAAHAALDRAKQAKGGLFTRNPDLEAAIAALDRLTKLDPNNAEVWCLRGQAAEVDTSGMRIGANKDALPFYEKAITADPKWGDAYLHRGLIRINAIWGTKDADMRVKGLADLDRAIELGVSDPQAYYERARGRYRQNNYTGAVSDYTEALRLGADPADILSGRAQALEASRDWNRAVADRTQLIEIKPGDSAYASRADDYVALKDWPSAEADYDKAVALDPEDVDNLLGRARMNRLRGETAKAAADYAAAHKLDATVPAVAADLSDAAAADKTRFDLGRAMRRLSKANDRLAQSQAALGKAERKKEKAEKRLHRLLAGDTRTDTEKLTEIEKDIADDVADEEDYLDRARIYAGQDKDALAIADCTKAIELKADYADAYNIRGILHESRKEYDDAFADYDKAVSLDGKKDSYIRNRGDIWWVRKDFDAAFADYDKAVALDPQNATNYFKRGNTNFMKQRFDAAIADYDKALEIKPDFESAKKNREIALQRKSGGS